MKSLFLMAAVAVALAVAAHADAADPPKKRPMAVADLFKFKRVAEPQVSPDGKSVVYQVTTVDLEGNKTSTALYAAATDGKTPPKMLADPAGKKDTHPRFSPDGTTVLFESNRSGTGQLWTVPAAGGEPKQLTTISTGAGTAVWSPDGKSVAFVSAVYPEFSEKPFAESDKLNKEKDEAIEKSPVKAKAFTRLFYRHWDEYVGDKRQHLFVLAVAPGKQDESVAHLPHDCTPGDRDAYPTSTTFSVGDDFTFTPDSKHLVFTAVPAEKEAWSTNHDLCRVAIDNASTKWEALTAANKGADGAPRFSPEGTTLAWRAQKTAGYEADKWDLMTVDVKADGTFAGEPKNLTGGEDVSVNEFAFGWGGDGEGRIAFTADDGGSHSVYETSKSGKVRRGFLVERADVLPVPRVGFVSGLTADAKGKTWAFALAAMDHPPEVMLADLKIGGGKNLFTNLSHANDPLLAELDLKRPESVKVKIEDGEMQMWILKPPGFDDAKKWPVAFLVHGGPQGAWEDAWSNRWNAQAWAAQGYVVVMPNPRGSTGFGQKFVDQISGDWGGKCYRDLTAGLDYVVKLPYVDKDRVGGAGGSFGGYMMDWFAVSDIGKRFKCLISHCSVWNFDSMWGTTDELWFDEWEHQGLPWEKPGAYAEYSPHKKAKALGENKTPMLVVHNDLDFRCPIGQGHELFSALQRQGVPSRFVNFPDEGHWVLKPRNSEHWHKEVFAWLAKYAPPGPK